MKNQIILFLLTIFTTVNSFGQSSDSKKFIDKADSVVRRYLTEIMGAKAVRTSVELDSKRSYIRDRNYSHNIALSDYKSDFDISNAILSYNFIFEKDTVNTIRIDVNDSMQIENQHQFWFTDRSLLVGWKNVLLKGFKFNFDKLKAYIKVYVDIDSATNKQIRLGYSPLPNVLKNGDEFYVEIAYFWEITIYVKRKTPDGFDISEIGRDIQIDAMTGKVLKDRHYEKGILIE